MVRATSNGDRTPSRAEFAYTRLRAAIHDGRIKPGDRVREADLAEWLGISRTPVRDALKRLETDGLLTSAPRRGLVVAELDQQQVSELYAMRDVLEGLAARLAAQHATPAEIAAMRDLLERQTRTPHDDLPSLARLNRLFHEVVYRAARNRYLVDVLDSFERSLALLPGTTYAAAGRPAVALEQHSALLAAIERRDAAAAETRARTHIRDAERIRLRMLSGGTVPESARHEPRARAGRPPARSAGPKRPRAS